MYTYFFVNIAHLLKGKDKVKLLRVALRLADAASIEFAHVFYELCPYLNANEKRAYGQEALRSDDSSLLPDLAVLTTCFEYLTKDEVSGKIRTKIDKCRRMFSSASPLVGFNRGFSSFLLEQGLAALVEHEIDSISAAADIAQQKELLGEAVRCFKDSPLWLARSKLAQAWISYSLGLRTSTERDSGLLDEAGKEAKVAIRFLRRFDDNGSLFSALRLLFLVHYRKFTRLSGKERIEGILLRQMRRNARLSVDVAEKLVEPVKLAGAYTNLGIVLGLEADHEPELSRRRRLLETVRELYLKAVSTVKGVSDEWVPLHLYNAGSALTYLARTEPNIARINELIETVLKEMDEVIKLSTKSTNPTIRLSAISTKLYCMDELAGMKPVAVTRDILVELDQLSEDLEEIQSKTSFTYPIAGAYMNLSLHCLKLLKMGGSAQRELIEIAERNALKAYKIAEETESHEILGLALYHIASILMVKGILNHDVGTLEQAYHMAEKSFKVLEGIGDAAFLVSHSLATEIRIMKYGYTGDKKELNKAIIQSRRSISNYLAHKYLHLAAEELFKLATMHMLTNEDREAEKALSEAAKLFRKSGKLDPKLRKVFDNYSTTCKATNKLVKAQIAYRVGRQSTAKRLVEEAEKEMIKANARWREVWLIRGFKELVSGNIEEARNNLARVIKESLDVVDGECPTSTSYTAKRLVSFIERDMEKKKELPPTVIDLPIRSEVILATQELDRLNKQLSSAPIFGAYTEQKELSIEEIRELIRRIMKIDDKEGRNETK